MQRVILASGSPRRRELLDIVGIGHEVMKSDASEEIGKMEPGETVQELARRKALAVAERMPDAGEDTCFILGADTVVAFDGQILGKPADAQDAANMLRSLSGHAHEVYTGAAIVKQSAAGQEIRAFYVKTTVHVCDMTEEEIDWYIGTGDAFDKAGSYGIQGPFAAFVDHIEGDYQNVVGLPVSRVYRELTDMGWRRQA